MKSFFVFVVLFFCLNTLASAFQFVAESDNSQLWTFQQSKSHFQNLSFFKQRVFIRPAQQKSAPIYIEICGEQRCNDYFPELIKKAVAAKQGHIVAIEHRYYGDSQPFADLATERLKYLSTKEALEDIRAVVEGLRKSLAMNGPVILFGCSYAGNLAAYFKSEFPNLVRGAVAVSAPVQAKTFIPEKDDFNTEVLGGCATKLRKSLRLFEKILNLMSDENFHVLLKTLHFKTRVSKSSVIELLGDLPSSWVNSKKHGVFCSRLSQNPDNLGPLIEAFARYIEFSNKDKDSFERAQKTDTDQDTRQWLYQTCSEYGFFQVTSTGGVGPLGKNIPFKRQMCRRLFGIEISDSPNIQNYHRRLMKNGKDIVFSNSRDDFWSRLSLVGAPPIGLSSVTTDSGGHCAAYSDFKNDVPGEQATFILRRISEWL